VARDLLSPGHGFGKVCRSGSVNRAYRAEGKAIVMASRFAG
jgi:hypothetical protein